MNDKEAMRILEEMKIANECHEDCQTKDDALEYAQDAIMRLQALKNTLRQLSGG